MKKRFALTVMAVIALAVLSSSIGDLLGRPTLAQEPTPNPEFEKKITIPLTFFQLNGSVWNAAAIQTSIAHANVVWGPANINFSWPNKPALHPLVDPVLPPPGDKGDVSDQAEVGTVCTDAIAARDNDKPNTFPVVLVGELIGLPGTLWGKEVPKDGPKSTGLCILLSDDNKNDPHPKPGETLAHEMGHAFCLLHTDQDQEEMKTPANDTNNLMHPTAKPTGNKLTKQQMRRARACAVDLRVQLGLDVNPVGGIADEIPDSLSDRLGASGDSGSNGGALAGAIAGAVAASAVALGGGAWYLRRRRAG